MMGYFLKITFLLICFSFPYAKPLLDQTCVSLGYDLIENLPDRHGLYLKDHGNLVIVHNPGDRNLYCNEQFRLQQIGTAGTSSSSIGGVKYGSQKIGTAALSVYKPTLGITVDDSILQPCCHPYNTSLADITVFGVKHNGRFLNGWLSFEVHVKQDITWAFVQVNDERANAIGEFVTPPEEVCAEQTMTGASAPPKKPQYLPCSATGLQEAKPSQSVVYVDQNFIVPASAGSRYSEYITFTQGGPGMKMKLTWRLNEYYCNRHEKFHVMFYFLTVADSLDKNTGSTIFQRSDWLIPKWFGVADIIPKNSTQNLSCDEVVTESMIRNNKDTFWIDRMAPTSKDNDNLMPETEAPNYPATLYKSCRTYLTRLNVFRSYVLAQPKYGGRCEKIDEKKFKPGFYTKNPHSTSSVDVPHQCNKNPKAVYPPDMENYKTYIEKKVEKRKSLCTPKATTCPQLKNVSKEVIRKVIEKALKLGPNNATGRYILKARAYHGMVFTWSALYFIPISNFLARFFKETFLSEEVAGFRVWYFVHMGFAILVINTSMSGIASNIKVSRVWGKSWSAAAANHRGLGWTCITLYMLVLILGPFRPENPRGRIVMMVSHAFLGYLQYFLGLFTIINSSLIPGSPSASGCYKNYTYDPFVNYSFNDAFNHKITTAVMWWMLLDILFYVLMTAMQWRADNAWGVRRKYYFPLVPIVHIDDRRSFKCFRYRTFVLVIYVFLLSVFVWTTCTRLYETQSSGCDCGPMTCTHANLSQDSVYPEVQCGGLAHLRYLRQSNGIVEKNDTAKKT